MFLKCHNRKVLRSGVKFKYEINLEILMMVLGDIRKIFLSAATYTSVVYT